VLFQWQTIDLIFKCGVFSKHFWEYRFVSPLTILPSPGVMSNSKYSRGFLGSSKPTFISGLPLNGKWSHSAATFIHFPCCMSLSSFTLSSSSELSLCLLQDKNFITILLSQLLSLLNSFSELTLHSPSFHSSSHNFTRSRHDFDEEGLELRTTKTSLQYSEQRGRTNEHGICVYIAKNRRICCGEAEDKARRL
jgi:hypothetical protein